jgi:hypothetical protein
VLDLRVDHWARADRLVWDLAAAGPHPSLVVPFAARRPVDAGEQLVHGDLTGNVLVDDDGDLAVVDFSPYWRPSSWSTAVVCVDAVVHNGAGLDAVLAAARAADVVPAAQMLLRAALFRSVTDVLMGGVRGGGRRESELLDQLAHLARAEG